MKRLLLRALHVVAAMARRTPLRRVQEAGVVRRLKIRAGHEMPAAAVLAALDALGNADIESWLIGGWGVDALLGRQTRRHGDLDVVVDQRQPDIQRRVAAALAEVGLSATLVERSIEPLPVIWLHANGRGSTVEVLPADLTAPPFDQPGAATVGVIDGVTVACMGAAVQRRLHAGYPTGPVDRTDLAALDRLCR